MNKVLAWFLGKPPVAVKEVQSVKSALDSLHQTMDIIHEHNEEVVSEQQGKIDRATAIQNLAAAEVKDASNFKVNVAKLFDTPVD